MKILDYVAVLAVSCIASVAYADANDDKGLAIQQKVDDINNVGFRDSVYDATMILRNAQGEETTRNMTVKTLEVVGDGDKEIGIFHSPADVRGTAVLTHSHGLTPDDQWLYLPELRRVKRISSVNKSGPFVGSEFAYEDIAPWEVPKYTYRYLRDEVISGKDYYVVQNTPAYEYSGYTRQIEWIDKEINQPVKVEYYDRKNSIFKTMTLAEYQQFLGRYWRAGRLEMVNHQNGKSTTLLRKNFKFGNGYSAEDFSERTLKNVN